MVQLVPLGAGLALQSRLPAKAERLRGPVDLTGKVLGLAAVVSILANQFRMLATIRPLGFAAMIALLAASLALGWIAGGPSPSSRRATAMATCLRNVGVGLVIAAASFPGSPAVSAAMAYGIVEIAGGLAVAWWWGRTAGSGGVGSRAYPGSGWVTGPA